MIFDCPFAIYILVEKECIRCKSRFNATAEGQEICPACLDAEFAVAATSVSQEIVQVKELQQRIKQRQLARAERLGARFTRNRPYSLMGRVRCALAICLFLLCAFVFMIGDSTSLKTPINQLELEYQLMVSVGCSLLSVIFLLPSFKYHKLYISLTSVVLLAGGAIMPFVWHFRVPEVATTAALVTKDKTEETKTEEPEANVRVLTDSDLEVYRSKCSELPRQRHFAVYMNDQTPISRSLVRESLTRLLQAEYTQAFTRKAGALFVVVNARADSAWTTRVLGRYGRITHAETKNGVFEVAFDAKKVDLVCRHSSDVLSSPRNPNFVAANISEICCLDPMRVTSAATVLANADVQILRHDIKNALLRVLQDPWSSEPDAYQALVEALVVYAPVGDAQALEKFRTYYNDAHSSGLGLSPRVVQRLIEEDPDGMVEPVVQMWVANPIAWKSMVEFLGNKVEDSILKQVNAQSSLQTLDAAMLYFEDYGTTKCMPLLEELLQHPDSLIAHKAGKTLAVVKARCSN